MPACSVTVTLSFDEAQDVVEALRIYRAAFIGSQIRDRIQDISDRVSDAADIACAAPPCLGKCDVGHTRPT